ncbi:hypothetical protein [Streptomyces sp. NPDC060194]|uniref:hypothetical protein n=1 Tax=Streptomyces sp. NPDC060194 TaxID=3347069 RepID=UPI003662B137
MTAAIAEPNTASTALGPAELQGLAAVMNLVARAGGADALLGERRPEPGASRLHIGYNEAAERLNIPEKWLRERISTLPHRKFGKFVQFAEEDLQAISDMHFVSPGGANGRADESMATSLRPSSRSRKRF